MTKPARCPDHDAVIEHGKIKGILTTCNRPMLLSRSGWDRHATAPATDMATSMPMDLTKEQVGICEACDYDCPSQRFKHIAVVEVQNGP